MTTNHENANPDRNGELQEMPVQSMSIVEAGPLPWHEPVNGKALLKETVSTLLRFVSMTREQAVAVALWMLFAHCHSAFRISAILSLVSPTKRCGKTTVLSILGYMVPRALQAARVTPAAIYRAVNAHAPSLLIDEADSFLPGREDLRGILNSGHVKDSAYVVLTVKNEAKRFSTWCPKVLALIGSLPDTLEDRSIVISLRRKAANERLEKLNTRTEAAFRELGSKAARWAKDNASRLVDAEPEIPKALNDRAADNWAPLLAIAESIGDAWPKDAVRAASALANVDPTQNMAMGELLLEDIRTISAENPGALITSQTIVSLLNAMEDRPWPEVSNGRPLTAPKLARMLKPFGIRPKLIRVDKVPSRAYAVASFRDAFTRYLVA
jgi:putative DNA primase/helicase